MKKNIITRLRPALKFVLQLSLFMAVAISLFIISGTYDASKGADSSTPFDYSPASSTESPSPSSPSTEPPPPPPPTTPPGTKTLTRNELNNLFSNAKDGVMFLSMPGNFDKLQINVPLSWFMENLGATLLIYNEGIGVLGITSENMIELAALSYTGTGGVTVEINGKEYTFSPNTTISYIMVRGSITLSVEANRRSLDWYTYDSPIIAGHIAKNITSIKVTSTAAIGIDGLDDAGWDDVVVVRKMDDGSEKIIARSIAVNGFVFSLVNEEGTYDVRLNPVHFIDISGHWSQAAARFMGARGVMQGIGNDKFAPDRTLTRAEFTTMLMRMMDYSLDEYDPMPFSDIVPGNWYYESVCLAAELGLTAGRGDGTFGMNDTITRQEMFKMTYDALRMFYLIAPAEENEDGENANPLDGFRDTNRIAPDALEAITELVRHGLVNGYNGRLMPTSSLSRADAAQFMTNVVRYLVPDFSEYIN